MKYLIAIAMLFVVAPAAAEVPVHVYEANGTTIRLMSGPCVEPRTVMFLSQTTPEEAGRFKAIDSTWRYHDGSLNPHKGCWAEFSAAETGGADVFVLIFDDLERYVVPKSDFLQKPGQSGT
jgi:hypothetical protein